jgi:hypothetical protein
MNRVSQIIEQTQRAIDHTPQGVTWAAAGTGLLGLFTSWVPVVASVLSVIWLALQIWLFFKKRPWRKL